MDKEIQWSKQDRVGEEMTVLSKRIIKTLKVAPRRTGVVLRMIGTSYKTNGGCPPRGELIQAKSHLC